jgi:serine/threonine protein kinase
VAETLITDQKSDSASYTILRRLGKGGMAEVFLARQEGLAGFRRLTVIKKLLPQFSQVPEVAEMLLDEARIAAQLTHPNIVQIYELGKDQGQYFIAMEYVDGCDLATLARIERHRQSRVPLRLTLRVVSEAAMGLDFAHRQAGLDGRPLNIVHRDVSPHNVMCSREGAVKVTDFGIAKAVGKALVTQVGVVKGKVQYMSPEQYTGGPVDHRSDIFSLGVVLYQLTTGKLPRVAKDGGVAMRRVVEGTIPRPSDLRHDYPDELEGIVMRALAQNPEERYPDAASLREDLLDFARDNDLLAFPKELGEYVNAMVPPVPLVVREQSRMSAAAHSPKPPSPREVVIDREPSVLVEGLAALDAAEDGDTEAPAGTEVASPGARRRSIVSEPHSDPFGDTEIPINSNSAVISERNITSSEELITPLRESGQTPRIAVQRQQDVPPTRKSPHVKRKLLERDKVEQVLERPPEDKPEDKREDREHKREKGREQNRETFRTRGAPPSTSRATAAIPAPAIQTPPKPSRFSLALIVIAVLLALGSAGLVLYLRFASPPGPKQGDPRRTSDPAAGAGVINVLANPPKAVVAVDGARRCPSTPCNIPGLPLGKELVLTVKAKGFELWMQRLVLTSSDPKLLLRADLTPADPNAPSTSKPPKTKTKTKTKKKPEAATPAKGARKRRPKTRVKKPASKKGPKSKGQVAVTPIQGENCFIAVDVRPWAEVWVDGKKIGHTPIQFPVPPGKHTIELRNPGLNYKKVFKKKIKKGTKLKISEAIQPPKQPPPGKAPPEKAPPEKAPPPPSKKK